jgi:valyl-tRNA synthetase
VGHCYRCNTVVEPSLSKQWFVSVKPLAAEAIKAVEDGRIKIHPKSWENTYFDWMYNIRDWCISRQIWWGHRIPAWHCECGEIIVSDSTPEKCPKCGSTKLEQETDVLDTWFSSALWPFSTLGWPDKTKELDFFYPTSVLITSFDILFFWVARMIMMGLHFMKDIPFKDVYLHALVRDENGQKMSKSKGNVMDPLLVIDKYGTDALRFTMIAFAAQGRDIRLSEDRIEGYRHFINKIWNAARFALMHIGDCDPTKIDIDPQNLTLPHQWILSCLNRTIAKVHQALEDYRYNDAALAMYQFVWGEFCDWYLEWIKPDLYGDDEKLKTDGRAALFTVLENMLKMLHPVIPFVTEEIWHALPGERHSIMTEAYPQVITAWDNKEAEETTELLMGVISGIRNIRSEMSIHPSASIDATVICGDDKKNTRLAGHGDAVKAMTRLENLTIEKTGQCPKGAASYIFEDIEIIVPLQGYIDVKGEVAKLEKERAKLEKKLKQCSGKLNNKKFLANAPEEIVAKEKNKLEKFNASLAKIDESIERLAEIGE